MQICPLGRQSGLGPRIPKLVEPGLARFHLPDVVSGVQPYLLLESNARGVSRPTGAEANCVPASSTIPDTVELL